MLVLLFLWYTVRCTDLRACGSEAEAAPPGLPQAVPVKLSLCLTLCTTRMMAKTSCARSAVSPWTYRTRIFSRVRAVTACACGAGTASKKTTQTAAQRVELSTRMIHTSSLPSIKNRSSRTKTKRSVPSRKRRTLLVQQQRPTRPVNTSMPCTSDTNISTNSTCSTYIENRSSYSSRVEGAGLGQGPRVRCPTAVTCRICALCSVTSCTSRDCQPVSIPKRFSESQRTLVNMARFTRCVDFGSRLY